MMAALQYSTTITTTTLLEDNDYSHLYEPLIEQQQQIRLFFLDIHQDDDLSTEHEQPISGTLVPWALEEAKTRFIAISYVWGELDISQTIVINGRPFPISTNLLDFLQSHRRRCRDMPELRMLPLWIDCICIDQADVEERNSQVALMKSIYTNAGMVISWFGASFHLCDWTFDVLRNFKEQIDKTQHPDVSKVSDVRWLDLFPQACKQDPSSDGLLKSVVWDSIRELCDHPYWTNIWIFQEVVLGEVVMLTCGDDVIPLKDVMQVIRWLDGINASLRKPENMEDAIWSIISSRDLSQQVMGLQSILRIWDAREVKDSQGWALLNVLRDHEASDPRDKIYASLGVTGLQIIPDYSKNVKDVYVEAAATLMKDRFEMMLMLSGEVDADLLSSEPLDLPSWVPDWTHSTPGLYSLKHPYAASRGAPTTEPGPVIDGYSMYCSGVVCDEIIAVESVLEPEDCLDFCCRYMTSQTADKYPSGIPHLRALFQLLLSDWETMLNCRAEPESMIFQVVACGLLHIFLSFEIKYRERTGSAQIDNPLYTLGLASRDSDLSTTFWNKIVGTRAESLNCIITGPREQQPANMNTIGAQYSATVLTGLAAAIKDRKIFHTKNGYVGIGLESASVGDQLCVAFGCNLPILLRPEGSHYQHVGTSYVVGLMEGEAMTDLRNGKRQSQRFEIR
ncbi:hypothetical protein G7054_g3391 [Neopestalotiopsis clavispora]|nr:hypothetical protein G7054_g3391 [Neopestalotiopsis clavispora]